MEYFFILGRNPVLSRAELMCYLDARDIGFSEILFNENYLILDLNKKINIQELGGVIYCGRILYKGDKKGFEDFVSFNDFIEDEKFSFSVIGNIDDGILVDKFKQEKRKAHIKRAGKKLELQDGEVEVLANSDYKIFMFEFNKINYLGIVEQEYDYEGVKYRDMQKPVKRESLAISPRLSKILINLAGLKKGQRMLDGFCGVGSILIEGLIKGLDVMGIDKNRSAVFNAKRNLEWLKQNYDLKTNYKLLDRDSSKISGIRFDGFVSETALGDIMKKQPSEDRAKVMIKQAEKILIRVLKNINQLKDKDIRIVITTPCIRDVSVSVDRICNETGLKLYKINGVDFPIKETRASKKVSRDIWIFD